MRSLVCFSHLRWDFVWQRPQQLLSRLAKDRRVFFVEEPVTNLDCYGEHLHVFEGEGASNVTVVRLVVPAREHRWMGHGEAETQAIYARLLRGYLAQEGATAPLLWFYTPMALPFTNSLPHRGTVYDVMDELSTFKDAPAGLLEQADTLLKKADVVFTGGVGMWRARQGKASNLHLFPSGVDAEHFAAAKNNPPCPEDMKDLGGPVLGYFGVIDERTDLALLKHLAAERPDWQLVMVGPVVKIDEADLPQTHNLHYLGMKPYEELPAYLARFDVALIPFGMNDATKFLSPTKTLEYLAGGKPVVSTPLPDVVELYGDAVRVGETKETFLEEVEAALNETDTEKTARDEAARAYLERYSWDAIARGMKLELERLDGEGYQRVA